MSLVIENIHKYFDGYPALEKINLAIEKKEFVCLLGPSGCGKTTLLRIIAGLLDCDSGKIMLDGKDLINVPARDRGFGIVFQAYSLFPHMTIDENIGYGLKIRNLPKEEIKPRVKELLDIVRLGEYSGRYPNQLSGGQQQRVAIARALAVNPSLLLLDEPLSALDATVRAELRNEIREVQQRLSIPTLMVTHDQEEALSMADKIVCMKSGRIMQVGSPQDLYLKPKNKFVADFMGHGNLIPQQVIKALFPELAESASPVNEDQELFIRPECIKLSKSENAEAKVQSIKFLGNIQRAEVKWRNHRFLTESHSNAQLLVGDLVNVSIDRKNCIWMDV